MNKYRTGSVVLVAAMILIGWFLYASQAHKSGFFSKFPFKLGLDLAGGTELVYKADTSQIAQTEISDSMSTLKDVIERRVNLFGVSEPIVQVEGTTAFSKDNKLIVDLPGVTDIKQAVALIGQTPVLDFRLMKSDPAALSASSTKPVNVNTLFVSTGLTGRYLAHAELDFNNQVAGDPIVVLQFNPQGSDLFAKITRENTGKILAIFLDNQPISTPVIRDEITGGRAQITGRFTPEEARTLVRSLNYGALPVPIELVSTQTVGPSLGASALNAGIKAGMLGLIIVAIFLIVWYRMPGLVASAALIVYVLLSLTAFKLIPVTLTAAGLAGFILSIGMAVDANILIFERMKEELRTGKNLHDAMHEGFHRAWLSIRDSNISSIITALVLFWLGTSAIKGFALTLGLGVIISMFTAITVSRTFLFALSIDHESAISKFLFGTGIHAKTLHSKN